MKVHFDLTTYTNKIGEFDNELLDFINLMKLNRLPGLLSLELRGKKTDILYCFPLI